ncbi:FIST C-terminal domain-containing protein [Christensenellaceae bacterium OttesenSCG-928-L17]|nr:FIST C-terminal domain-containing protein [Christensenellaceae bacterium OttesenSCG-928-L17]
MINMLTAYTFEVDDENLALREILEQLNLKETQLQNSVGILSCHADFVETGVAQYIAGNLAFDVIGCTSMGCTTGGESSMFALCLSVITSDELAFTTAWAHNLEQAPEASLGEAVLEASSIKGGKVALTVPFLPISKTLSSEYVMNTLVRFLPGAPVFGTVACDNTLQFERAACLINDEVKQDSLALLLVWGEMNPVFFVAHISEKYAQKYRGVITKAEGNLLQEINNMPAKEYLETIGISVEEAIISGSVLPLLVEAPDGTKAVALGLYSVTPEGYVSCGGSMPVNGMLAVGTLEANDILKTTEGLLQNALDTGKRNGMLMFPCGSRYIAMGDEPEREMDVVKRVLGDRIPFFLHYGWGELCPMYDKTGTPVDKFHNFSFIGCIF